MILGEFVPLIVNEVLHQAPFLDRSLVSLSLPHFPPQGSVVDKQLSFGQVTQLVFEWLLRILGVGFPSPQMGNVDLLPIGEDMVDDIRGLMVDYCREKLRDVSQDRANLTILADIHRRRVGDLIQRCSSLNHWLAKGNLADENELGRLLRWEETVKTALAACGDLQFVQEQLGMLRESRRSNIFLFGLSGLNF